MLENFQLPENFKASNLDIFSFMLPSESPPIAYYNYQIRDNIYNFYFFAVDSGAGKLISNIANKEFEF